LGAAVSDETEHGTVVVVLVDVVEVVDEVDEVLLGGTVVVVVVVVVVVDVVDTAVVVTAVGTGGSVSFGLSVDASTRIESPAFVVMTMEAPITSPVTLSVRRLTETGTGGPAGSSDVAVSTSALWPTTQLTRLIRQPPSSTKR
jgi:hypothetical protein